MILDELFGGVLLFGLIWGFGYLVYKYGNSVLKKIRRS